MKTAPNFPKIPRRSMRTPVIWSTSLLPTCQKSAGHIQLIFFSFHLCILNHMMNSRSHTCCDGSYLGSKIRLFNNKHRWKLGVRYLQTSKKQRRNVIVAFLLEQNSNKETRTERADLSFYLCSSTVKIKSAQLGRGIPAVPHSRLMSQSNINYPIQMTNNFLKGSKRVLKLKTSHKSQAAQTSCLSISKILKLWPCGCMCLSVIEAFCSL